jgi:hypothetical protein
MKDGIGTIYISIEEFFEFIREKAGIDESTTIIIGRPRWLDPEEIEIDYAFSETTVPPDDWAGESGKRVKDINSQWDNTEES